MVRAFALALGAALAAAAAGCSYHARFVDCAIACSAATGCPDGFACGAEGYCRPTGGGASCAEVVSDAAGAARSEVLDIRATPGRDLDLLFVIDDSPSMADKQDVTKAALPAFFRELALLDGGLPNLHVGVVSSDMGTKGSAVVNPGPAIGTIGQGGCTGPGKAGKLLINGAPVAGAYLEDVAGAGGARVRNYTDTLEATVGQMIALGEAGCGFEQPLAALRAALSPGNAANAGFLRPGASLGVIIISDEDDCSILDPAVLTSDTQTLGPLQSFRCFQFGVQCDPDEPLAVGAKAGCRPRASSTFIEDIAPFRAFLAGVKPDPHDVSLGVVVGPATPVAVELRAPPRQTVAIPAVKHVCEYTGPSGLSAVADPGVRFDALVQGFPGHARLESICGPDLTPVMTRLAQATKLLVGDACLEREITDAGAAPGIQGDCFVEDVAGAARTLLKPCSTGAATCWQLVEDPVHCASQPQHLRLAVTRADAAPAGARTVVHCATP